MRLASILPQVAFHRRDDINLILVVGSTIGQDVSVSYDPKTARQHASNACVIRSVVTCTGRTGIYSRLRQCRPLGSHKRLEPVPTTRVHKRKVRVSHTKGGGLTLRCCA